MNDIRFVLTERDELFEEEVKAHLGPFSSEIDVLEEKGDDGTTIIIICTILSVALATPGFVLALKDLFNWMLKKRHKDLSECATDQVANKEPQTEKQNTIDDCSSAHPWYFILAGKPYDLSALPSDYERLIVLDKIIESIPQIIKNDEQQ